MIKQHNNRRAGFTLVELLVVIAIIGILIGMAIPAVQGMREASRRSVCAQRMTKISLGLSEYALVYGAYPVGSVNETSPIENIPVGYHHNWIAETLPYIDYQLVYQAIDPSVSIYAPENVEAMTTAVPAYRCPSATGIEPSTSCYAGIHHPVESPIAEDNLGVFILNRQITDDDIQDGLAMTLFVSEKLGDFQAGLGWLSGTRASLRNTGHPIMQNVLTSSGAASLEAIPTLFVGGFASGHEMGVNGLMGDGATRFLATTMDQIVLGQMADRRDGALQVIQALQ